MVVIYMPVVECGYIPFFADVLSIYYCILLLFLLKGKCPTHFLYLRFFDDDDYITFKTYLIICTCSVMNNHYYGYKVSYLCYVILILRVKYVRYILDVNKIIMLGFCFRSWKRKTPDRSVFIILNNICIKAMVAFQIEQLIC
jgi:hypothetical protein